MFDDIARQELESELNARYDYIEEAYGPTRDDATLFALTEQLAEAQEDTEILAAAIEYEIAKYGEARDASYEARKAASTLVHELEFEIRQIDRRYSVDLNFTHDPYADPAYIGSF